VPSLVTSGQLRTYWTEVQTEEGLPPAGATYEADVPKACLW